MTANILNGTLVESEGTLAEWLCVAFMQLKDDNGLLIGGHIPPSHALQIAKMLLRDGLVEVNQGANQ